MEVEHLLAVAAIGDAADAPFIRASALLAIAGAVIDRPAIDVQLAVRIADGFNTLLSFKGGPAIAPAVEAQIREFLHRLLGVELPEEHRAAVCALRGVG